MAYRPIRVYSGNIGADNTTTTLYTVPAGETLLITSMSLAAANGDVGGTDIYLGDNDSVGGWGGCVSYNNALVATDQRIWHGFYVVNAGGAINTYVRAGSLNAWFHINGVVGTGTLDGGTPWRHSQNVTATGDTILATVPAGRTLVIKSAVIANPGALNTAALRIGSAPIAPYFSSYAAGEVFQLDGSYIAAAGENILANVGTPAAAGSPGVSFYLSGVLY